MDKKETVKDFGLYPPHKSVLIVGSGSCLKDYKAGELIDKFRSVYRFGDAPVRGYEGIVGSKTTHRFVNNKGYCGIGQQVKKKHDFEVPEYITFRYCPRLYLEQARMYKEMGLKFTLLEYSEEFNDLKRLPRTSDIPTAGYRAIDHALTENVCVYVHGFNWLQGKEEGSHYYGNLHIWTRHKPSQEAAHLRELIKQGRVRLLTDYL